MAAPSLDRRLSAERRRALELLAGSPHGVNEELLVLGHGSPTGCWQVSSVLASQQHGMR